MMKKKQKLLPKTKPRNNLQEKLTLSEHFREFSYRFYWWALSFVLGSYLGYFKYDTLLTWLIAPLKRPLFYTSPIGGFEAVFGVSLLFGFLFSLPVLTYHLIKFIEPVNDKIKSKKIIGYAMISVILAAMGIAVSDYLVFPATLNFLSKFGSNQLESLISTRDYFAFVTKYLLGFAILFQLPLVIYLINLFTPVSPKSLLKQFKYVFAASFLIAAILTPTPDFINQSIMATPIILLYLISILILYMRSFVVKWSILKSGIK